MLGEKDLIYFGAILLWNSNQEWYDTMNKCVEDAKKIYDKVFNENE